MNALTLENWLWQRKWNHFRCKNGASTKLGMGGGQTLLLFASILFSALSRWPIYECFITALPINMNCMQHSKGSTIPTGVQSLRLNWFWNAPDLIFTTYYWHNFQRLHFLFNTNPEICWADTEVIMAANLQFTLYTALTKWSMQMKKN